MLLGFWRNTGRLMLTGLSGAHPPHIKMQMSCTFLCDHLWELMHKMDVNKDVHSRHDRHRKPT